MGQGETHRVHGSWWTKHTHCIKDTRFHRAVIARIDETKESRFEKYESSQMSLPL